MKLREIYNKYREIINYLIFGVLTTLVSFFVYFCVLRAGEALFSLSPDKNSPNYSAGGFYTLRLVAQILQWIAGVLFAFFTNRRWVFNSGGGSICSELVKFSAGRVATLGLDTAVTLGLVSLLTATDFKGLPLLFGITIGADGISKAVAAVFVIIANYIISKFFVFKKKD